MHLMIPGRGWGRLLGALTALFLLLLAFSPRPALAEPPVGAGADLILVIDRSGSMQENDPQNLAVSSAQVFLALLHPSDRVAVVAFDTDARTVLPLQHVGDGAAARDALEAMGRPTGAWTDVNRGLEAALGLLDGQADPSRQPAVILFTDGKPQTRDDGVPPGYMESLRSTVGKLAGRSVPLFTVGLGQADFALLGEMSASTRAESFAARSAEQVMRLFPDVLSRIKGRHVAISFEEDLAPGQPGQTRTFEVPPYTRLLTLSAIGSGGQVRMTGQMPGGTYLEDAPGATTATGGNYMVLTIPDPRPGTWMVRLEGAGRALLQGQTESAIRIGLESPAPYSQVDISRPVPVTVSLTGDPDPTAPLELWAQAGGEPVRLERSGTGFTGKLAATDGRLVVWATRAGQEVSRREFRIYPVGAPTVASGAAVQVGEPLGRPWLWPLAFGAALAALLGLGAWRWRRLQRRLTAVSGRIGTLSLSGHGSTVALAPGPVLAGRSAPAVAQLTARLLAPIWAPLVGLGLRRPVLQIYIRPVAGGRLELNGAPAGDGRLYHGDRITIGGETWIYHNPPLGRRPLKRAVRKGPAITLKG